MNRIAWLTIGACLLAACSRGDRVNGDGANRPVAAPDRAVTTFAGDLRAGADRLALSHLLLDMPDNTPLELDVLLGDHQVHLLQSGASDRWQLPLTEAGGGAGTTGTILHILLPPGGAPAAELKLQLDPAAGAARLHARAVMEGVSGPTLGLMHITVHAVPSGR